MASWTGHTEPKRTYAILGRRYWWFEIQGTSVDMVDELVIPTKANNIPTLCTVTYFVLSADGVATLNPWLARNAGATEDSEQVEKTNDVAAVKISNQQPACLVLESGVLVVKPRANADGLNMRLSVIIAEGHDVRGI